MTKRILLIDDSEFILESTSTLLMFEGYDVITANGGAAGIKMATEELPDLIICDVSMPEVSGYDVIEYIRANEKTTMIPFIFLTAFTDKVKMREGMEKGADDYLTKPFTKKELTSAIDSQWQKTSKVETKVQTKVETVGKKLNYALPHEFRTVMSQLVGSANLIKNNINDLEKEDIVEVADEIISIVNRLTRITDNFLLYTKLENYANSPEAIAQLQKSKTDEPFVMFSDIAETVSMRYGRANEIDIKNVVFDISISMSSDLFHKLVDELIDNAFKFSKKGNTIMIDSKITDDNKLFISIADQGLGMTQEQIKEIGAFMQFQREEFEQQGVGIGLTIAKNIIELHNGTMEITSEKEKGTTVSFTLPIC
jgi:K+-sensing histidine kinase KdpD